MSKGLHMNPINVFIWGLAGETRPRFLRPRDENSPIWTKLIRQKNRLWVRMRISFISYRSPESYDSRERYKFSFMLVCVSWISSRPTGLKFLMHSNRPHNRASPVTLAHIKRPEPVASLEGTRVTVITWFRHDGWNSLVTRIYVATCKFPLFCW